MSGVNLGDTARTLNSLVSSVNVTNLRNKEFADYQYEVITEAVLNFQKQLDDSQDVALLLASFGQTVLMQVTSIGYSNPSLIHFFGYVNGRESELIQHVNQISFLITSTPKDDPTRGPIRIKGFAQED